MNITKWTPGPWYQGGDGADIFAGGTPPSYADAVHVGDCQPDSPGLLGLASQHVYNARLIAAAPDLYEALAGIMHYARMGAHASDVDTSEQPAFVKAEAALAKALRTEE